LDQNSPSPSHSQYLTILPKKASPQTNRVLMKSEASEGWIFHDKRELGEAGGATRKKPMVLEAERPEPHRDSPTRRTSSP
jgi:hypothetical protein